ncbi:MAG: hypothetical protein ACW963_02290 [Candidatus Sifarchaeia archaeon]
MRVTKKLGQYTVGIIIRKEDFNCGGCFFRVRTATGRDTIAHPTDMELINASR